MGGQNPLAAFCRECTGSLIPLLNGLFAVTITTSLCQRVSGTVKPFFLTICPAACAWPATMIRTTSPEEEFEFCFNTTLTENHRSENLVSLLRDARMSFPSFQEAIFAYVLLYITCYWHMRRVVPLVARFEPLRLLFFTTMTGVLLLMSHSKIVRHKHWLSDVICGIAIGVVIALHQMIGSAESPCPTSSGQLDLMPSVWPTQKRRSQGCCAAELKRVSIPRVTYRHSLAQRRLSQSQSREDVSLRDMSGATNASFFLTNKH